jgi:CRP/FNR family transcriptional regulator, nitrogen fixation regulation protein
MMGWTFDGLGRSSDWEVSMTPSIRQAMVRRARQFDALTPLTSILCCSRGQQVCSQGEPADRWFWIINGTARRSVIRLDGRRQIVDLLLPGDCFGFTNGDEYDNTVEAVAHETCVARCVRRDAEAVAESNPQLAREIRLATFEAMLRLQSQVVIVGRTTAIEKVGAFLLDISTRVSSPTRDRVVLPVSRYDMADYLGLSVETVSRSLTDLKRQGVIELFGPRSVGIVDRAALECGDRLPHGDMMRKQRARPAAV